MSAFRQRILPLLRKELLQLRRSRSAMLTSMLLPILTLIVVPLAQLRALRAGGTESIPTVMSPGAGATTALLAQRFGNPDALFTQLLLPLFVALTGVLVPAIATAYAVVTERERRSIDLLMALPVTVAEVLIAKVLSVLFMALGIVLPLFAITLTILLRQGILTPLDAILLCLVLAGSLTCSIGVTFVITIVARDYRTANNLSGFQVGPVILFTPVLLLLFPPGIGLAVLAAVLAVVGVLAFVVAWRWITFERYLA